MMMRTQKTIRIGPQQALNSSHSVFPTQGPHGASEAPQPLQMLDGSHFLLSMPVGDARVK